MIYKVHTKLSSFADLLGPGRITECYVDRRVNRTDLDAGRVHLESSIVATCGPDEDGILHGIRWTVNSAEVGNNEVASATETLRHRAADARRIVASALERANAVVHHDEVLMEDGLLADLHRYPARDVLWEIEPAGGHFRLQHVKKV